MDAPEGRADRQNGGQQDADPRGSAPPKSRGESGVSPGTNAGRPADSRKKRAAEQRYAGWGDGLDRLACASAVHGLARGFPPQQRGNLAIIAPAVVARRPDALLICAYAHCGPHLWPDGEIVAEEEAEAAGVGQPPPSGTEETRS